MKGGGGMRCKWSFKHLHCWFKGVDGWCGGRGLMGGGRGLVWCGGRGLMGGVEGGG